MTEEIAALRAENQRLNAIISILLEQIALLKKQGASLNVKSEEITNDISALINQNGSITNNNATLTKQSGISGNDIASLNVQSGNIERNNAVGRVVPAVIEINGSHAAMMSGGIRKHFHVRLKYKSMYLIAKELLHLHNQGFASAKELQKITGLTYSGFSKHIIIMRRRGLLKKESWQKFILTDKAKQLIADIFGREAGS